MLTKKQGFMTFHPGEYIKDELEARNWKQKDFAEIIGKSVTEVNELIKGKRNITTQWAILIGAAFGQAPETWLNLQHNYDIHLLKTNKSTQIDTKEIIKKAERFNHFSIA